MPPACPQNVHQSGGEPGTSVGTNKLAAESGYHNPDPLVWLLCHANEAMVVVDRVEMTALVDIGSQIPPSLKDSVQKWA